MVRNLSLGLLALGLSAIPGAAQCTSAPTAFTAVCAQLQAELDSFDSTLASQWNGVRTPLSFGSDLTTANANRGITTLLAPATFNGVQNQLNAFATVGLQAVTIAVHFPLLYQPFYEYNHDPQDYARIVTFYQNVIAAARGRGMKVLIESSVLFPNIATDLPLNAYYATLSSAQVTAGRAQVAQVIAQQLQPDWLNLGSEPDTQASLLSLSAEYTPQQWAGEISTIVTRLRQAGISGKPLIGAGIGTWQMNGSAYVQALLSTGIDLLDLHIYSINLGYLGAAVTYFDMARAAGKGAALSEAWLKKLGDSQLQGKSEYGIIAQLSSSTTNSYDTFSFWSPLDSQFILELVKLGYWKNLYYISPFNAEYFFAYLDYNQVANLSADQTLAQELAAATAAMRAGTLSPTGQAYAAAIQAAAAGQATTVSAASGAVPVAPGSIVSIGGSNLALEAVTAPPGPLPASLGGITATIADSGGIQTALPLFYVSPSRIGALIPDGVNTGPAAISITTSSGPFASAITLAAVAPGLFSADSSGAGVAWAQLVFTHADGSQTFAPAYECPFGAGTCVPIPIDLSAPDTTTTLILYGTGIHNFAALADISVRIGAFAIGAADAGAVPAAPGLDQVSVVLPRGLAGAGNVSVTLAIAGTASNALSLSFQ